MHEFSDVEWFIESFHTHHFIAVNRCRSNQKPILAHQTNLYKFYSSFISMEFCLVNFFSHICLMMIKIFFLHCYLLWFEFKFIYQRQFITNPICSSRFCCCHFWIVWSSHEICWFYWRFLSNRFNRLFLWNRLYLMIFFCFFLPRLFVCFRFFFASFSPAVNKWYLCRRNM